MDDQRFFLKRTREKNLYEVIDSASGKRVAATKSERDYVALLLGPTTKPSEKALYKIYNRFGSEALIGKNGSQFNIDKEGFFVVRLR